jgi:hypothetical protein
MKRLMLIVKKQQKKVPTLDEIKNFILDAVLNVEN